MKNKAKVLKVSWIIIFALLSILVLVNVLFIKIACSTRQCFIINISTILMLVWAAAFLFVVLKYSKKSK